MFLYQCQYTSCITYNNIDVAYIVGFYLNIFVTASNYIHLEKLILGGSASNSKMDIAVWILTDPCGLEDIYCLSHYWFYIRGFAYQFFLQKLP